jgi:hypothetical protein
VDCVLIAALGRALDLTEAMLEAAREGAWEQTTALEAERQRVLHQGFAEPAPLALVPHACELIEHILHRNATLVALAEAGRQQTSDALRQLDAGRRARRAYRAG